jgi:hypothetical protein
MENYLVPAYLKKKRFFGLRTIIYLLSAFMHHEKAILDIRDSTVEALFKITDVPLPFVSVAGSCSKNVS